MRAGWLAFWLIGFATGLLAAPLVSGGVVLASKGQTSLSGQIYAITVVSEGLYEPQWDGKETHIIPVAASMDCPGVDGSSGLIQISGRLTQRQQAKALIHEAVHAAITCDIRKIPEDERIAESVSDLLESSIGRFVVEGLRK